MCALALSDEIIVWHVDIVVHESSSLQLGLEEALGISWPEKTSVILGIEACYLQSEPTLMERSGNIDLSHLRSFFSSSESSALSDFELSSASL